MKGRWRCCLSPFLWILLYTAMAQTCACGLTNSLNTILSMILCLIDWGNRYLTSFSTRSYNSPRPKPRSGQLLKRSLPKLSRQRVFKCKAKIQAQFLRLDKVTTSRLSRSTVAQLVAVGGSETRLARKSNKFFCKDPNLNSAPPTSHPTENANKPRSTSHVPRISRHALARQTCSI